MQRLQPEDDYFLRCETDNSPMNIGALIFVEATEDSTQPLSTALRTHLEHRLPATPLLRVRHEAPDEYDADVWCDVARCDLAFHTSVEPKPLDHAAVRSLVARLSTERLDLTRPPFHIQVIDEVAGGGAALFLRVHHAVADGLGFQHIVEQLTDPTAAASHGPAFERAEESPPARETWLAASAARFDAESRERPRLAEARRQAKAALAAWEATPGHERVRSPRLERTVPSSRGRAYQTLDLPLGRVRAVGAALGGTVNDTFLAVVAGAARALLSPTGELPEEPLVAVGARSYRRPEHGPFGNRITNLMTSLATHIEDPAARYREIHRSSRVEIERSRLSEPLLSDQDRPYGPRTRRLHFAEAMQGGRRILPGQVVVSNVPGPSEPRYVAGHRILNSYPAPLLGYGRMLNITLRRYVDTLNLAIMADTAMLTDVDLVRELLLDSLAELEACV